MTETASAQAWMHLWTLGTWKSEQEMVYVMKDGNACV